MQGFNGYVKGGYQGGFREIYVIDGVMYRKVGDYVWIQVRLFQLLMD